MSFSCLPPSPLLSSVGSSSEDHTKLLQRSWGPWLLTSPLGSSPPVLLASAGQAVSIRSPTSSVPAHSTTFSSSLRCHCFCAPPPPNLSSRQVFNRLLSCQRIALTLNMGIATWPVCFGFVSNSVRMRYVDQKHSHCVVKTLPSKEGSESSENSDFCPCNFPSEENSSDVS